MSQIGNYKSDMPWEKPIRKYVLGFAFTKRMNEVILISKKKPNWQKGLLNGVGGICNHFIDKDAESCMKRHFEKETGVLIPEWRHYATIEDSDDEGEYQVIVFTATTDMVSLCESKTDEGIIRVIVTELPRYKTIPNLQYLVPMALDMELQKTTLTYP